MPSMHYTLLIQKHLTGVISLEETRELDEWLASDLLNRQEFEEIRLIWEYAGDEDAVEEMTDEQFKRDRETFERAIKESREKETLIERIKIAIRYKNALIGTMILIIVSIVVWVFKYRDFASMPNARNAHNNELIHSDGFRVFLNDSGFVSVAMNSETRKTDLTGEAFFDVRKNERPSIVHARDVTITVWGASFLVKNYCDSPFEVFVVTGEVTVEYQDSREVLFAGEKATVTANNGIQKSVNDDHNFNSWYTRFGFQ